MSEAAGAEERARLRPGHYRHPAEVPTLVASLWLAITALLVAEGVMVLMVTVLVAPTRGASLYVGIALATLFHGGLIWGLVRVSARLRHLRRCAVRLDGQTRRDVREAVKGAALALGLGFVPEAQIVPGPGLGAQAVGFGRPELYLDEGLLGELLDPLELRAVIARELGHIAAGHVALRTLFELPARERLAHPALMLPMTLAWLCLRWWWPLAERTADRAAAIVVGGPEPLGHALSRLACAAADRPLSDEEELRAYCDDVFAGHPARLPRAVWQGGLLDATRIRALARFAHSERFGNCLALAGHLSHKPSVWPSDPEPVGLAPYAVNWVLALLYLSVPVALWAISTRQPQPAEVAAPPAMTGTFDPEAELPDTDPAQVARPLADLATGSELEAGLLELARMHKDRGEYDKARRALEDLIRTNPLNAEGHYVLAWVCVELGDRRAARAEFTAALNLTSPGSEMHTQAQQALGRMGY